MTTVRLSATLCVPLAFESAGSAYRVYMALRLYGAEARPAVPTLASALGLSNRGVDKALGALAKAELVSPEKKPGRPTVWHLCDWTGAALERLGRVLDRAKMHDYNKYDVGSLVPGLKDIHPVPTRGKARAEAWADARREYGWSEEGQAACQQILRDAFHVSRDLEIWTTGEGEKEWGKFRKKYTEYLAARAARKAADVQPDNYAAWLQTVLDDLERQPDPVVEGAWDEDAYQEALLAAPGLAKPRHDDVISGAEDLSNIIALD